MKQPVSPCSRKGILLVEAVLCAVVIATGLVFISRALGSQVKALRSIEAYETLSWLGRSKLLELETERLAAVASSELMSPPLPGERSGTFEPPYNTFTWEVTAKDDAGKNEHDLVMREVIVTVQAPNTTRLQLVAVWPADMVPDEWL